MATIQTAIQLQDRVTPVMSGIVQSMHQAISGFEDLHRASGKAVSSASLQAAKNSLAQVGAQLHQLQDQAARGVVVKPTVRQTRIEQAKMPAVRPIEIFANVRANGFAGVASSVRDLRTEMLGAENAGKSLISTLGATGIAVAGIAAIAGAAAFATAALIKTSDEYAGIMARIKLVTGGAEEAAALNDQIYYSALRARGGYAEMATAVSKLGLTAKEAFPDPQAIVPFIENIQKLFTIGGTAAVQQKDAMLQLTQALGSGKLQGDEFRSIAEAAPMIEQMVAKYMGVTQGELKGLSTEGKITAEIMKNAILGATDEIEEKFAQMPRKWADNWQQIKTIAFREFVPVFNKLSELANSPVVQAIGHGITAGIHYAAVGIVWLMDAIEGLYNAAATVGTYLGGWLSAGFVIAGQAALGFLDICAAMFPVIVAGALGVAAAWAVLNARMLANMAISAAAAAWQAILTAWAWVQAAAIWAVNAAKAAWAALTMGVAAAQLFLAFAVALVTGNLLIIAAIIAGVVIAALALWALASSNLAESFANAMDFIIDACQIGVNAMVGMINGLINVINKAAGGLNGLFGTSIGQIEHVGEVNFQGAKKWTGYIREGTFMQNLGNAVGGMFEMPQMPDLARPQTPQMPTMAEMGGMGGMAKDAGRTADNTGRMADKLDASNEDLKKLRDMADRESINRFTTAKIKVDMTNHNNVSSNMDLDGIVGHLNSKLTEQMSIAAEGVR